MYDKAINKQIIRREDKLMKANKFRYLLTAVMITGTLASAVSVNAAEIDMNEDPYEVAIQVVNLPGMEVANEADIEAAINEITLPAINCTVDVQYVWISEVANTTSLGVASGEKLDILHVATVNKLSSLVGQDILYDMNEDDLLNTRGQQLIETFGDKISAGEVDGMQLAVPEQVYMAQQCAAFYNKTVADSLGITVPETCTIEELGAILEQVHEGNPDIMPFFVGAGTTNLLPWIMNLEGFGNNYSYGAIVDFVNDTTIENIYATDVFKDYCLRMYDWRQKGIIQKDSTDSNTPQDYFNAGQLFLNLDVFTPTEEANVATQAAANGFESGVVKLDVPEITNSVVSEYMWGIAVNSQRPDKAMDFLNFLYSNADVANLILYGIEGVDYTVENNIATRISGYNPVFYKGGDTRMMYISAPNDETYMEKCEALDAEAIESPIIGYIFNDEDYQTEAAMIGNVINEHLPALQNGAFDSEEDVLAAIGTFVEDLQSGGIDDVIEGNQEQLDAFLASK